MEGKWYGLFLVEKLPFLFHLRYPPAAEKERLDEVLYSEKEIAILRAKLTQPISESPVHKVRAAAAQICAVHEAGEGTELMIAKALVKDLRYDALAGKGAANG